MPKAAVEYFTSGVPSCLGVVETVHAKAHAAVAKSETTSPILNPEKATQLLGTMLGGYNIQQMIDLLECDKLSTLAANSVDLFFHY